MIFKIYAVKDELVGKFLEPTFIENEKEALRIFSHQVNNIPLWKSNSSDYSLFTLGTYDQETGSIIGIVPEKIINGRSVIKDA